MLPKMWVVKQKPPSTPPLSDLDRDIVSTISRLNLDTALLKGKSIGVAVGSRGINKLPTIVKSVVSYLKEAGAAPVIFAAMGSHGGGTAEGQMEVLSSLGITELSVGAPVNCCAETNFLGNTKSGYPVYANSITDRFDAIVPINRVKPHTDFNDITESGLLKMFSIGIGNPRGCQAVHTQAISEDYGPVIREVAAFMIEKLPVLFGLMVTENWKSELDYVEALLPTNFLEREKAVLAHVKDNLVKLPVKKFDSLIVNEMGKNISGTGMDTKVIGRIMVVGQKEPEYPKIGRIVVLNLTDASHGNAIGMGLADITTKAFLDSVNFPSTSLNCVSSMCVEQGRVPCVTENDKEAIEASIISYGIKDPHAAKIIYIKNTAQLEIIAMSDALWNEHKFNPSLEAIAGPLDFTFDESGRLTSFHDLYN